jgi:hypothetical protein
MVHDDSVLVSSLPMQRDVGLSSSHDYRTYWYYFYTIYYSPATYTTRTTTTVTMTTICSVEAEDVDYASISFDFISYDLPTPDIAYSYLPPTPTPGQLIVIACAANETTSSDSSISGVRLSLATDSTTTTEELCTVTASETSGFSSPDDFSAEATGADSSSSGDSASSGSASGTTRSARIDALLVLGIIGVSLCAVLMVVL